MATTPVAPNYGTLSTLDTLAASQQTIAKYGEDKAWEAINRALDIHNEMVKSFGGDLYDMSEDRLRRAGNPASGKMVELDEFGQADAQKITAGYSLGFPLREYGYAVQWTRKYLLNAKASEIAAQYTAAMDADSSNIIVAFKKCFYSPTNYLSEDRLVDHLNAIKLPVKALVNADGLPLPIGPNGEVFNGATHTHYLTCATPGTLTVDDAQALIDTVVEHVNAGKINVIINHGDEAAWRSLAGFVPYHDVRITQPTINYNANGVPLNVVEIFNRAIGVFGGAEIWVRPWAIAGYSLCYITGSQKPLLMRVRDMGNAKMSLAAENDDYPLRAKQFEREFGFGVQNRVNGAILDMTNGVYTMPTVNAILG